MEIETGNQQNWVKYGDGERILWLGAKWICWSRVSEEVILVRVIDIYLRKGRYSAYRYSLSRGHHTRQRCLATEAMGDTVPDQISNRAYDVTFASDNNFEHDFDEDDDDGWTGDEQTKLLEGITNRRNTGNFGDYMPSVMVVVVVVVCVCVCLAWGVFV